MGAGVLLVVAAGFDSDLVSDFDSDLLSEEEELVAGDFASFEHDFAKNTMSI